jgi:hypothetical protein
MSSGFPDGREPAAVSLSVADPDIGPVKLDFRQAARGRKMVH